MGTVHDLVYTLKFAGYQFKIHGDGLIGIVWWYCGAGKRRYFIRRSFMQCAQMRSRAFQSAAV